MPRTWMERFFTISQPQNLPSFGGVSCAQMSGFTVKNAPIKWAQRKDSLYLTIALADVKDHQIELKSTGLTFSGKSNDVSYSADIAFFKEVDSEGSIWNVLPQSVQMKIMKKDKDDEEFWPRLLKDKVKEKNTVSIDWDRYVDEDEGDQDFDMDGLGGGQGFGGGSPDIQQMMAQMQAGGMGGMGGMPGMGDDEADSDDDEELPDLEEAS